jgi:hypothetical protein
MHPRSLAEDKKKARTNDMNPGSTYGRLLLHIRPATHAVSKDQLTNKHGQGRDRSAIRSFLPHHHLQRKENADSCRCRVESARVPPARVVAATSHSCGSIASQLQRAASRSYTRAHGGTTTCRTRTTARTDAPYVAVCPCRRAIRGGTVAVGRKGSTPPPAHPADRRPDRALRNAGNQTRARTGRLSELSESELMLSQAVNN